MEEEVQCMRTIQDVMQVLDTMILIVFITRKPEEAPLMVTLLDEAERLLSLIYS